MSNGKMFKVLFPIEKEGKKHWVRLGTAFTNRDESINCYLETLPIAVFGGGKDLVIQIRELSEDDLRRRDEFRATRNNGSGDGHLSASFFPPSSPMEGRSGDVPF